MALKITLVRSPIGYSKRQKRTVEALGLRRLHQSVLVTVEEVADNAVTEEAANVSA